MNRAEVAESLANITSEEDFADHSYEIVKGWLSTGAGVDAVEPVLRFMEAHQDWDLGSPGDLVHFVERFFGKGYEEELIASIQRLPTAHTLWMLNRLINGEKDGQRKARLLALMVASASAPDARPEVAEAARQFETFQTQAN